MKIALISDIHSNLFYLTNVLRKIEQEEVDDIYCLGDLVGYYDKPNEVIDLVIEKKIKCVKGNHEKYLTGEIEYNEQNEKVYGIKKQKKILSKSNYDFIQKLEDSIDTIIDNKFFYFTHSLPNDPVSYIRSVSDLNSVNLKNIDYYCFGHTHSPFITYYKGACILNPGSIGQPRDYTKKPSYIILDTSNQNITVSKIDFDISGFLIELESKKYPKSLIDILKRGKT
jgi:putative phosphoesterase